MSDQSTQEVNAEAIRRIASLLREFAGRLEALAESMQASGDSSMEVSYKTRDRGIRYVRGWVNDTQRQWDDLQISRIEMVAPRKVAEGPLKYEKNGDEEKARKLAEEAGKKSKARRTKKE